ncbi:MAG: hypothetical protein GX154_03985 [Clostridiales bacterium]|nr:hypothetical protein [Clostridiales bacterium]
MKILMELDENTLQKYTARSGIPFGRITPQDQAVIVLLPDTNKMEEVFDMNMPTAVIAADSITAKETAKTIGYPDEAIIVFENNVFKTLKGEMLFDGKNIPLSKIVTVANYILENDILPEIIVWRPTENIEKPQEVIYKEPIRTVAPIKPELPNMKISLAGIADTAKMNIFLIKTSVDSESGAIAHAINQKINGLHIDITGKPYNSRYGHKLETALSTQRYGYSHDGMTVEIAGEVKMDTVLYEIDAEFINDELLQKLYDKSQKVYQVPSTFKESIDSIKSWIGTGFRLDGIIATVDAREYKQEWPNLSLTVQETLEKL